MRARLEAIVRHLERIDRPSASVGEAEAAGWIAERLRGHGLDARLEQEDAHGGYWWPLGLLNVAGLLGWALHRRGHRRTGSLLTVAAAALMADDLDHRTRWFRKNVLPSRTTTNVVAEAGDRAGTRTVVLVAHHDAAHGGVVFDTTALQALKRHAPGLHERMDRWPPLMWLVIGGPVLMTLGARRTGALMSLGSVLAMIDIGHRPAVPGANDNLTAVAALIEIARILESEPVEGLRVVLLSTGAEESNSEGMQGFADRHFAGLPVHSTDVIALECLGSGRVVAAESEGFLLPHAYDAGLKDLAVACGRRVGVDVVRGLHVAFSSDGQIALHAGYRSLLLGGIDELKLPANYHQLHDTADNVDFAAVEDSVKVLEELVRTLADQADSSRARPTASAGVDTSPA